MSYDVSIGGESFNYTFNTAKIFYEHIPDEGKGGGIKELHDITGKRGVEIISAAFMSISNERHKMWVEGAVGEPAFCAKYDAKNGWGNTIGSLCFLAEILGACAKNRRKKMKVWL